MRPPSVASLPPDQCDGPVPDTIPAETEERGEDSATETPEGGEMFCSDRAELIERLKRGESPTWVPNLSVSAPRLFLLISPMPTKEGERGRVWMGLGSDNGLAQVQESSVKDHPERFPRGSRENGEVTFSTKPFISVDFCSPAE